jgi:hypothetical protein
MHTARNQIDYSVVLKRRNLSSANLIWSWSFPAASPSNVGEGPSVRGWVEENLSEYSLVNLEISLISFTSDSLIDFPFLH